MSEVSASLVSAPPLPLILLPGIALGDRLFAAQLAAFPQLRVPEWIEPRHNESLPGYARRMAKAVDPGGPCIVGGASFGGAVALEMATHLSAQACVLIGSFRHPRDLPWLWRTVAACGIRNPASVCIASRMLLRLPRRFLSPVTRRSLARMAAPDAEFERWAMCAAVNWKPTAPTKRIRTFQIHGDDDHILPVARTRADTTVPGGRHALTLFNANSVIEYLTRVAREIDSCPGDGSAHRLSMGTNWL